MQLSRSLILESILSARPGHTLWHEAADRILMLEGRFRREPDIVRHSAEAQGEGQLPVRCVKKELALARTWSSGVYSGRGAFKDALALYWQAAYAQPRTWLGDL